jgi:hypothetical protein
MDVYWMKEINSLFYSILFTYILASGTLSGGGRLDGRMSQQPNQNGRRQVEHLLVWHLSLDKKYY